MKPIDVIGRFAPSPTGDLHFGSLVSAVGSYLEAKHNGGKWLLRIEDIDPPREVAGSAARIIEDLRRLGLVSDEPVLYQSTRYSAYQQAVEYLLNSGSAYPCACSRKDLPASGLYPGNCRNGLPPGKQPRSIRFRAQNENCSFKDQLQGENHAAGAVDDFIIRRADGLFAYQLAVVVDDHFQGITQVVRGADLLDSTCRQIGLQKSLGIDTPRYMHLPVVLTIEGQKLSKRRQADPITNKDPAGVITQALRFLGQDPPAGYVLRDLWKWAVENWNSSLIPREKSIYPA